MTRPLYGRRRQRAAARRPPHGASFGGTNILPANLFAQKHERALPHLLLPHRFARLADRHRRDPRLDHVGARHDRSSTSRSSRSSRDLHAPLDEIQWVATGYLLSLAAIIPVTGWAGKRFGARTRLHHRARRSSPLGSALCGLAWSAGSLIAFRVLQGIGGGMLTPIGQIILVKAAGPREPAARHERDRRADRPRARSSARRSAACCSSTLGWQSIFLINVPIGILTLFAALRLLPARPARGRRRSTRSGSCSSRPASSASPTAWPRRGATGTLTAAAGARAAAGRRSRSSPRSSSARCASRSRCSTCACTPTARSAPRRSRRSASAPRCSAR